MSDFCFGLCFLVMIKNSHIYIIALFFYLLRTKWACCFGTAIKKLTVIWLVICFKTGPSVVLWWNTFGAVDFVRNWGFYCERPIHEPSGVFCTTVQHMQITNSIRGSLHLQCPSRHDFIHENHLVKNVLQRAKIQIKIYPKVIKFGQLILKPFAICTFNVTAFFNYQFGNLSNSWSKRKHFYIYTFF